MPPRDPRLRPALERVPPDDIDPGSYQDARYGLEVLFGDGEWRYITVIARFRDRRGREVIQVSWTAGGEHWWGETYVVTPGKVREAR